MDEAIKPSEVQRIGGLELNLLNYVRALPKTDFEGARLDTGTPIYDVNGELLFFRTPIVGPNGAKTGYADFAAHTVFGAPLLGVAPSAVWDEQSLVGEAREARAAAQKGHKGASAFDEVRFVAYSYPKLAVEFRHKGKEVSMLELMSWAPVPPSSVKDRKPMEPGSFERWSLIDEMPQDRKKDNLRRFEERVKSLNSVELKSIDPSVISANKLVSVIPILRLTDTEDLHYSTRQTDHHTCYELRGQETSVWCVGASTQMVLDFYRYEYTQSRIATQLGLGTLQNPNGLPYARDNDEAVALNALSSGALTATMLTTPPFSTYCDEIRANRPLVSFIPGHSRTVAGYTESLLTFLGHTGFRGLLVYDPWPPNVGVITRWENFDTQTYRRAFTAHVTTI
jgi:hypothetical protein